MKNRNTRSSATITGRIDSQTHNIDDLSEATDKSWDTLSDEEKFQLTREVDPVEEETVYNVTTDRFHEYIVDNLDPAQTSTKDNLTAAWVALGTDSDSGTSTTDTDLNNRVFEKVITDHADNGKDLLASTFIDSTEANGDTLNEIGLLTGDPTSLGDSDVFLINHATFSDVTKDNSKTVTFDVTLSFSDV